MGRGVCVGIFVCMMHLGMTTAMYALYICVSPTDIICAWITRLENMVKVHSRLLTCPLSTILICMMQLGMASTMYALTDLYSKHEQFGLETWVKSILEYWYVPHQTYWFAWCIFILGMTTAIHALEADFSLYLKALLSRIKVKVHSAY